METVAVILGIIGLAQGSAFPQQQPQHYYHPQTGKHYILYKGYMYEQNVSQNPGYQNQPTQGVATSNWAPQPPNGQWYPQYQTQTAANPQGYYR